MLRETSPRQQKWDRIRIPKIQWYKNVVAKEGRMYLFYTRKEKKKKTGPWGYIALGNFTLRTKNGNNFDQITKDYLCQHQLQILNQLQKRNTRKSYQTLSTSYRITISTIIQRIIVNRTKRNLSAYINCSLMICHKCRFYQ